MRMLVAWRRTGHQLQMHTSQNAQSQAKETKPTPDKEQRSAPSYSATVTLLRVSSSSSR